MPGGRPLLFQSVEELEKKIGEYFFSCWDFKRDMFGNRVVDKDAAKENEDQGWVLIQVRPYTVGGLAVALNCSRNTLCEYGNGEGDRKEFQDTIKEAKAKIEGYAEEALYTGKNQAGAIFVMKNCYGWKDKTEMDLNAHVTKMEKITVDGKEINFDIGENVETDD